MAIFAHTAFFGAASARSTKSTGPVWAQSRHSLRIAPTSAMREERPFARAAIAGAAFLRKCNGKHITVQRISAEPTSGRSKSGTP
jgi:hypothetical protein